MKCSRCNRDLQPGDELRWECHSCHQICRANLPMLEQIQAQRDNGYTAAMVNCPFCGTVLDDGNETIHWSCPACGEQTTDTIKNYLKPELLEQSESEESSAEQESEFAWFDENGEAMDAPPEEPPSASKSFFASEDEKKDFLAETKSQALGEEIPDSIFEDAFPIRKSKETKPETPVQEVQQPPVSEPVKPAASPSASASGQPGAVPTSQSTASPFVEPPVSEPVKSVGSPSAPASGQPGAVPTSQSSMSPFVEPPASEPVKPAASPTAPASEPVKPAGSPTTPASEPVKPASSPAAQSGSATVRPAASSTAAIDRTTANTTTSAAPPSRRRSVDDTPENHIGPSVSDQTPPPISDYVPPKPASKQILPKVLTGILTVIIVAAVLVGGYFAVNYYISPTRQFRSAVKAADYTKALEIYNGKIKGDREDEHIAKIAVEHFLHERYEAFKNGSGGEDAYEQILRFAQDEMGMETSNYELASEPTEAPEPTETPEPTPESSESPVPEETDEPSEATDVPDITPEPTAEVTTAPEVTPEPTPEPAAGEPGGDTQLAGADAEVAAAIQKANNYVKKKKYEKAYNHLAKYKDTDTTGQINKEMSSVKKKWKTYNIKTFKTLCDKLTIVYYASEKRYHIVPRGYYTNYNQISRSNNVGGIAYMDQNKKSVSITNIGKDASLSSFGKTNRANLKQFKEMIEKYPYLGKEIK